MKRGNGTAGGRFGDDLAAVQGVLLRPVETFGALRTRHPVLVPWLVGSALSVGLTLLTVSVSQRAAAAWTRRRRRSRCGPRCSA
jgi:uncharacterized protein (DUF2062 family)